MARSRQLRRFLRACLLLALGAALAAVLLLPELGRRAVRSALHRLDPRASFVLAHISPWRMTLVNVALGDAPWLTAKTVHVTYQPFEALAGRVRAVVVDGATWMPGASGAAPAIGLTGATEPLDLPLERLELHDSAVVLETDGAVTRVSLAVTMQRDGPQRFLVSVNSQGLTSQAPGAPRRSPGLSVQLDGALEAPGPRARLEGRMRFERLALAGGAIEGFDGRMRVEWLGSSGLQQGPAVSGTTEQAMVRVEVMDGSGRLGTLPFRAAEIEVSIEESGAVLVEQARWTMGDSARVTTAPFRFDPRHPVIDTMLSFEEVSLSYWLPLLSDGRAAGEGMLDGRVPVTWRPGPGPRFALGEGAFDGAPGGGWITVSDLDQLATLLDQGTPGVEPDENLQLVKQRLVEALADFHYDALRLELVRQPEGLLLRVHTSGRGRRGDEPQEIGGLTINIHDFDTVLSELLSLKSATGGAAGDAPEGRSHE